MTERNSLPPDRDTPPLAGLTYTIVCGVPGLACAPAACLDAAGAQADEAAAVRLVLDTPPTFAYHQLACAPPLLPTIVVTANTCPEYVADLWELQPAIVIVGDDVQDDVIAAVQRARNGERYCAAPGATRLAPTDRAVLRYAATGWTYAAIASQLGLAERTVRNRVSAIYTTLGLRNRAELTLYYLDLLGLWAACATDGA
ncbi:MAG: response regulator transcription factor [Roseiflexus sp.]